jgi:hypothetical protein
MKVGKMESGQCREAAEEGESNYQEGASNQQRMERVTSRGRSEKPAVEGASNHQTLGE